MIRFMVIAAPRSGTTWAANWLTTDRTLCYHDPLYRWHYSELDAIESAKRLGVSCTGLACFPDWVNAHPARKVILHRPENEVRQELVELGLPWMPDGFYRAQLDKIKGQHHQWTDIFERPREIYEYLLELPFDEERHAILREISMQPNFEQLKVDPAVTRRLVDEVRQTCLG